MSDRAPKSVLMGWFESQSYAVLYLETCSLKVEDDARREKQTRSQAEV